MKVNFGAPITDLRGEIINGPDGKMFTLGKVAVEALSATYKDEAEGKTQLSGEEKVKRFKLAVIAVGEEVADVSVEDIATMKKLIGKAYPPLVVGRAYEILEAGAQ